MTPAARPLSRRDALGRIAAATAVLKTLDYSAFGAPVPAAGIGTDPNLLGKDIPWPRVLTPAERRAVTALADAILPADAPHPAASAVGVPDFIDEWVSAPYETQQADQKIVREALAWFDAAARARGGASFADLPESGRTALLDAVGEGKSPEDRAGLPFFQKIRALVIGGYYSTPAGWADIGYVGNRPIGGDWPGPPREILDRLGLTAE